MARTPPTGGQSSCSMDAETREQAPLGKSVLQDLQWNRETVNKSCRKKYNKYTFKCPSINTHRRTTKSLLGWGGMRLRTYWNTSVCLSSVSHTFHCSRSTSHRWRSRSTRFKTTDGGASTSTETLHRLSGFPSPACINIYIECFLKKCNYKNAHVESVKPHWNTKLNLCVDEHKPSCSRALCCQSCCRTPSTWTFPGTLSAGSAASPPYVIGTFHHPPPAAWIILQLSVRAGQPQRKSSATEWPSHEGSEGNRRALDETRSMRISFVEHVTHWPHCQPVMDWLQFYGGFSLLHHCCIIMVIGLQQLCPISI